ncbi:hypothetical protein CPB84DRAFT_1815402 [Gymnopilus junonius]|uniref:Zinc finger Mcm10/DnaG-type domain-containing protein n=1 Tax=Gymnopilus junonius TaxID=109634 RepID=A0A9P5NKQ7_GYMJU|nr:hypothetical protein CPB84DRAFT_1815402 [Gymnopilus junonius]
MPKINKHQRSKNSSRRRIQHKRCEIFNEPESDVTQPKSPKRKAPEPAILVPSTPSPKKKQKLDHKPFPRPPPPVFQNAARQKIAPIKPASIDHPGENFRKPPPANVLEKLARIGRNDEPNEGSELIPRPTGFKDKPKEIQQFEENTLPHKRDERLALVDELEPGPYEHNPPLDDPTFEKLEPHSGIYMSSRLIPHEEISDYLRGRYYLSPSQLYSCIRLLPDKQGYDIPVPGDWVTIAVVAERGPIKFTRAPVAIEREDGDPEGNKHWKGKGKANEPEKPTGKKYVNLKLIDFGARSSPSSATGGISTIRGDAFLTLLLFQSDAFDLIPRDDGRKPEKVYRGGSRGAFEHLTNVKEGDVIALLNPKILKPFQRSSDSPHPVDNVLALTPESAASIVVLGKSRDLGMCSVRKQDGKVCGSWCDKRLSEVCDYHVQHAVQRRRAARPEFSIGTSGMSTSSKHKAKNTYDPMRKWGLKPAEENGPGVTYVVSGHVVSGTSSDPRTMYISESMGREGQAKAKRQIDARNSEKALKMLLHRDKEAREATKEVRKEEKKSRGTSEKERIAKKPVPVNLDDRSDEDEAKLFVPKDDAPRMHAYSATVIQSLGFDPSLKPGQRRMEIKNVQDKLEALEAVRKARKDIALGPRPGPRIRSGVVAPKAEKKDGPEPSYALDAIQSDDELPEGIMQVEQPLMKDSSMKMVDLDDF